MKGVVVWRVRIVVGVCMGFSVKVFGEKRVVLTRLRWKGNMVARSRIQGHEEGVMGNMVKRDRERKMRVAYGLVEVWLWFYGGSEDCWTLGWH